MTNNHEIKLAKVGELVLVSGCEKPVPTRNFRILQAEKETKTDMMNPVMQRCSCREYAETAVPEELLRQLAAAGMQAPSAKNERPWEF
ncbi:MAG: nitroreductase family protein [Oscillospiraceae bacterium]